MRGSTDKKGKIVGRLQAAAAAAVMLFAVILFAVAASADSYLIGDADGDGVVSVIDATRIQRILAELITDDGTAARCADLDGNGLDITDATRIQRYLAGYAVDYPIGSTAESDTENTEPTWDEYELPVIP